MTRYAITSFSADGVVKPMHKFNHIRDRAKVAEVGPRLDGSGPVPSIPKRLYLRRTFGSALLPKQDIVVTFGVKWGIKVYQIDAPVRNMIGKDLEVIAIMEGVQAYYSFVGSGVSLCSTGERACPFRRLPKKVLVWVFRFPAFRNSI